MITAAPTKSNKAAISLFTVFLCLLACALYYYFFFNRAQVVIELEVAHPTVFKLYWSGDNQKFSEKRSGQVRVLPRETTYSFSLTDISDVTFLRLDPVQYPGDSVVKSIVISQTGFKDYSVDLSQAEPLHDIAEYEFDSDGLHVKATGKDPNFLVVPQLERQRVNWLTEMSRYVLICLTLIVVVRSCASLRQNYSYVPIMLAMVLVLVTAMAATSKRNAHPDERVHLAAATYYQDHWLPPEIEDPAIAGTYSPYGISRLNNGEIYYLLAGKFSKILSGFNIDALFLLRSFNIFLFVCILLYSINCVYARLVALPFLISPQVWYIFSYCGSDAFGLFLCFVAGCQISNPDSHLNRILDADRRRELWYAVPLMSCLLAMMLLLKVNYYPFIALSFFCVLWKVFVVSDRDNRGILVRRVAVVIVLALIGAGLRFGADYFVNGTDRQEKLLSMQEQRAHHWFKPSTELDKKHVTMFMKDRGTTLRSLVFGRYNWFGHTFVSGFGHYGYFTVAAPARYYAMIKWAAGVFVTFIFGMVLIRGTSETRLLALTVLLLGGALIGASLHRSWTVDFQAQGRYLFPILPMIGVLLARSGDLFTTRLFTLQLCYLYALSIWSFIFVALVYIPRPF